MNDYTKTPVNTVIYVAILSLLLGLLAFAGPSATNAIFSLSIVALYVAYAIPIAARFVFKNDFQPGPFNLGRFVSSFIISLIPWYAYQPTPPQSMPVAAISVLWMSFMGIVFLFPTLPQTDVADMNYTVVVMGGTLLLSLVWYYFPKYGGVHWFTGPVRNIDSISTSVQGKDGVATNANHVKLEGEKSDSDC